MRFSASQRGQCLGLLREKAMLHAGRSEHVVERLHISSRDKGAGDNDIWSI